jgi:hypothetical protein
MAVAYYVIANASIHPPLDVKIPSGVALLGPTRLDDPWQARAGAGFDAQHFLIDWEQECTTCPAGKTSAGWTPAADNRGNAVIKVKFSTKQGSKAPFLAGYGARACDGPAISAWRGSAVGTS